MNLEAMRKISTITTMILSVALLSCTAPEKKYKIGVSQCSADVWREKQNAELRMGAYFHDNVELRFAAAYDDDARQVQQIDSLVSTGIDLLIVAPNQVATISPAIDRAYDQGIPVIVFERKTNSQKYTAFISADNYEMGRTMGQYIATQLSGRGRVMEVMGLKGSSPAIERHNGFMEALKAYPQIEVVATLQGDWTEESAVSAVTQWLATSAGRQQAAKGIDFVYGQNDRMAMGARKALGGGGVSPRFCGIDGLTGEGGGIQLVCDSILDASYIYPTHGDQLLQLAVDILDGKPYAKETAMMSALVTRDNARVLLMQNEDIIRRSHYLDQLHTKVNEYIGEIATQRMVIFLGAGVIVLLLAVMVLYYLYHRGKITLRRERVVNNLWNLEEEKETVSQQVYPSQQPTPYPSQRERELDTPTREDLQQDNQNGDSAPQQGNQYNESTSQQSNQAPLPLGGVGGGLQVGGGLFITRFKEVVESQLSNSDLSVEDLASAMNLSRVQLYRKVKSITGSSPVELLRTARLNRAYQMLMTTDKSVSEVAYAVGFSAPSYFTKCYKDEFGMLPGEMREG